MMCLLKKNAVIFKVGNRVKDQDPIVVIQQKNFTKEEPDSCIPLLGIYDGAHYQSVLPASKKDEELTQEIVKFFPEFQGNFEAFFKDKTTHQKDGLKSPCYGPVPEPKKSGVDGQDSSYEECISDKTNSEMADKNRSYEESVCDQKIPEIDGQHNGCEESVFQQNNSEIVDEKNIYEESVSDLNKSEMDGKKESYEESVSDKKNSEIDDSYQNSETQENSEELVDNYHLKKKEKSLDFEKEAMMFITMQDRKYEKRARQRIRDQVI